MKVSSTKEICKELDRVNKNKPFNKHSKIDKIIPVSEKLRDKINDLKETDLFYITVCGTRKLGSSDDYEVYYGIELVTQFYNK